MSTKTLYDIVEAGMKAARLPSNVRARIRAIVEEAIETYSVTTINDLVRLPEWNIWLVLVKSIMQPIHKLLRREGLCHATYYIVAAFTAADEKLANIVREWVRNRCKTGLDPCCSSPKCCNLA